MGWKPALASLAALPSARKVTGPTTTGRVVIPRALASLYSSRALLKLSLNSVSPENSGTTKW